MSRAKSAKHFCREKVLFLEEMAADPIQTLVGVFEFLGMDLVDDEHGAELKVKVSRNVKCRVRLVFFHFVSVRIAASQSSIAYTIR